MAVATRPAFLSQSGIGSPLGRITLTGTIHGSLGLPPNPMRILGSYALVYLLSGTGRYEDARGTRLEVSTGDLLLLFPEIAHTYAPPSGSHWDEIYIVFDGPVFDLWRQQGLLNPDSPFYHLEPVDYWRPRFAEVSAPGLSPLERLCRLQSVLADTLTNYRRDPAAARDDQWLASARALLDADVPKALYVDQIAKRLRLSPETFRKRFARLAGIPPWRYRMTRVIERACRLVHESRLTNKEIAAQLNFNDEFHFSRRFKQITGRSPTQFRALSARR
jgi:AraC-like DNA-binding protein